MARLFALAGLLLIAATARADTFPKTTALQNDLTAQQTGLNNLAKRLENAGKQVDNARTAVTAAIILTKAVAKADDKMGSVIKELKTLSSIPQLKMLPSAVKLLENVRKQIHAARLKTDKFHNDVLKSLDIRLKTLKNDIQVSLVQVKLSAAKANLAHAALAESRKLIEQRRKKASEVAALETLASVVRVEIKPTTAGIAALDRTTGELEKQVNLLIAGLKAFTALKPGIDDFLKDIEPFSDIAAELKKVMTHRVSVKIFNKEYGFTVKQVLEGPKNIADFILKPLQDLADKAVAEVMKTLKLKLDAPPEIAAMHKKMEAVVDSVTKFPPAFDLNVEFLKTYDQSLTKVTKK